MKHLIILFSAVMCAAITSCTSIPMEKAPKLDSEHYNRAMNDFKARNYFDAIPAFEELREKFPLSPYAVLAEIRLGESHFNKEEFIEASHYFENFRRLHPSNELVAYSIYMTGMCHYRQILTADRDQTAAQEAAEQFQLLIDLFPESPYAGRALCKMREARSKIAEHEFFVGQFYFKKKNYRGAAERYKNVLKNYPNAMNKEKLLFYLAEATLLSGNVRGGISILTLLLEKYPDGDYRNEAEALRALHEENSTDTTVSSSDS